MILWVVELGREKKKEEEVYGSMFQYICEKHFGQVVM
jgi:hypothetical protein